MVPIEVENKTGEGVCAEVFYDGNMFGLWMRISGPSENINWDGILVATRVATSKKVKFVRVDVSQIEGLGFTGAISMHLKEVFREHGFLKVILNMTPFQLADFRSGEWGETCIALGGEVFTSRSKADIYAQRLSVGLAEKI